jgi:diguanylate cyclase (GGDEF)-like protein
MVAADLDGFKRINDGHGHDVGDAALREVAKQMRTCLRSFELFYRLGGEEFLVVLPGVDLEGGVELAERLRVMVEQARPGGVELTVSIGVAAAGGDEVEFEPLFAAADEALYRAKRAGRNRVATAPVKDGAASGDGADRTGTVVLQA